MTTISQRSAYVLCAAIVALLFFASTTPSALYETYSRLWGFSAAVLTLVYATYALGVLVALLLAGRVSDSVGRRPVLVVALTALIAASVLFADAHSVVWLFAARGVQGVATGLAVGTASAGLLDFHPSRDPAAAGLTNGVVSAAGLGFGVLTSATLVQLLPAPRVLPYLVLIVLFASALAGVLRMPEPVSPRARFRLTPQRPHVPRSVRRPFVLAALATASAYSIGGLFFSLGPALSGNVLATGNHVATAASLFLLTGIGSAAQLAYRGRPAWIAASAGCAALAAGVTLIALAAATDAAPLLLVGAAIAGAGFGLAFLGALRTLSAAIPADQRAGVMSAFFVVGYTALSAPAVGAGLVVAPVGLRATFEVFAAVVATLALVVAIAAWRTRWALA